MFESSLTILSTGSFGKSAAGEDYALLNIQGEPPENEVMQRLQTWVGRFAQSQLPELLLAWQQQNSYWLIYLFQEAVLDSSGRPQSKAQYYQLQLDWPFSALPELMQIFWQHKPPSGSLLSLESLPLPSLTCLSDESLSAEQHAFIQQCALYWCSHPFPLQFQECATASLCLTKLAPWQPDWMSLSQQPFSVVQPERGLMICGPQAKSLPLESEFYTNLPVVSLLQQGWPVAENKILLDLLSAKQIPERLSDEALTWLQTQACFPVLAAINASEVSLPIADWPSWANTLLIDWVKQANFWQQLASPLNRVGLTWLATQTQDPELQALVEAWEAQLLLPDAWLQSCAPILPRPLLLYQWVLRTIGQPNSSGVLTQYFEIEVQDWLNSFNSSQLPALPDWSLAELQILLPVLPRRHTLQSLVHWGQLPESPLRNRCLMTLLGHTSFSQQEQSWFQSLLLSCQPLPANPTWTAEELLLLLPLLDIRRDVLPQIFQRPAPEPEDPGLIAKVCQQITQQQLAPLPSPTATQLQCHQHWLRALRELPGWQEFGTVAAPMPEWVRFQIQGYRLLGQPELPEDIKRSLHDLLESTNDNI